MVKDTGDQFGQIPWFDYWAYISTCNGHYIERNHLLKYISTKRIKIAFGKKIFTYKYKLSVICLQNQFLHALGLHVDLRKTILQTFLKIIIVIKNIFIQSNSYTCNDMCIAAEKFNNIYGQI